MEPFCSFEWKGSFFVIWIERCKGGVLAVIHLSGVKKIFSTPNGTVQAVNQIDLSIQKGEIFGVIGYSGAGKSTLIRMLNLLETPSEGSVLIDGQDLTKVSKKELRLARQQIGMIFQHFNLLWSRSVYDNIAFSLEISNVSKAEIKTRVMELIELVGLQGREDSYPSQLSGGQKQRVGIARALANHPKVLLCDEATSALDPQTTEEILDLLVKINRKYQLTIVLITHEMDVIQKICNRVAIMEKGNIVEEGNVLKIFQNPSHPVTQRFIKQAVDEEESHETIDHLLERFPEGHILQLKYANDMVEKPFITEVIRKFKISINIIHGKVIHTQVGVHGSLYIQLTGSETEEALQYLTQSGIEFEVIK